MKAVLERAVAEAGESLGLSESERPGLDHDTKGEPGLVSIPEAILAKIDSAAVFVGDITPVATTEKGRHVANPNVLIELGYAKKTLGPSQIILVWNSAWGGCSPEDLPFDLRHRRAPFTYSLPEDASGKDIAKAADALVPEFSAAIAHSLRSAPFDTVSTGAGVEAIPTDPSVWFAPQEVMKVNAGTSFGAESLTIRDAPRSYARIVPSTWPKGVRPQSRTDGTHDFLPLGDTMGLNWGPTKGGVIIYDVYDRSSAHVEATTATKWFGASGELWGIDGRVVFQNDYQQEVIAAAYIVECWARFLRFSARFFQRHNAQGPFSVRLGVTRLEGLGWPRNLGRLQSTVLGLETNSESDTLVRSWSDEAQHEALREGYAALRAAFGLDRDDADLDRILSESKRL